MSDFTSITLQYNTGADSASGATWTGNTLQFGGSGNGANELRWAMSGASTTTPSATWPYITRPSSAPLAITQLWAFSSDASGQKVATYDGTNSHSWVLRWSWDNTGTFAGTLQFSAFGDNTHSTPQAGTQPPVAHNDAITNGSSTDTSNTSYLKIAAYGYGVDSSGNQQSPTSSGGAAGSSPSSFTGTNGAITTTSSAWSTWQSAQGWLQYIANGVIPQATTAGFWYWTAILYTGPNMTTSTYTPVITFQYAYS